MEDGADFRLDVCGVCCPLPLIHVEKSVRAMKAGQTLLVVGNDPIFESSVRDYCSSHGHAVLGAETDAERRVAMLIRVGG